MLKQLLKALFCLLLPLLTGCLPTTTAGEDPSGAVDEAPQQRPLIPVEVARVRRETVTATLELTGTTQAWDEFLVNAEISGRVSQIHVEEGAYVRAGELLLELDREKLALESRSREARFRRAQADLDYQRKRMSRGRSLLTKGAISQSEVDTLEQAVSVAESELELARIASERVEQELGDTRIMAPVAGQMHRRHVSLGETVNPAVPLFTIIQLDPLKVLTEVAELDLAVVRLGQAVDLSFRALPEASFRGVVHRLDPVASSISGSFPVEVRVTNSDGGIRPGMIAHLSLSGRIFRDALIVPLDAVVFREGASYVFVVREGIARRQAVEVRSRMGTRALLAGSLTEADLVVVRGANNLTDGTPVEVIS